MRSWTRLLPLLAICIVAGYFVGRAFWTRPPPEPPAPATAAPTHVPAFELRDLSGVKRSIGEWSSRALLVNFWATWCAPCRKEMPLLEQVHQERAGQGLTVIGIAIDQDDAVRSFVTETGVTYPILVGQEDAMAVAESFAPGFVALPMTVVVAPGGEILLSHVGELHPEALTAILDVLDRLAAGRLSIEQARQALRES